MPQASVISLIVSNLVPVFGVLFLGWSFANIVFLYWFENIIIGFYTVAKMARAESMAYAAPVSGSPPVLAKIGKYFLIVFFIMHFGGFTAGHGLFLLFMLQGQFVFQSSLLLGIVSMFISHGISYYTNYIKPKAYLQANPAILMAAPYPRIFVVHLTVIFSGLFLLSHMTLVPIIIFTVLKTLVDLGSHVFEHRSGNVYVVRPGMEKVFNLFALFAGYGMKRYYTQSVKEGTWTAYFQSLTPEDKVKVAAFLQKQGITLPETSGPFQAVPAS